MIVMASDHRGYVLKEELKAFFNQENIITIDVGTYSKEPVDYPDFAKPAIEKVLEYANAREGWHIAPDNREGVRIIFDLNEGLNNGWFLLRLSVHDPVLPLNVESDVPGGLKQMLTALYQVLKDVPNIDLSILEERIDLQA